MPRKVPSAPAGTEDFPGILAEKTGLTQLCPGFCDVLEVWGSEKEPTCGILGTEVFQRKFLGLVTGCEAFL